MWYWLFIAFLIWSCGNSGDGPLSAYDSSETWHSSGFYLGGELSQGRWAHSKTDTLPVKLSQVFVQSFCFWETTELVSRHRDSIWHLSVQLPLRSSNDINCAIAPLFDTVLHIAPQHEWRDLHKIVLWGADSAAVMDSLAPSLSDAQKYGAVSDTIWLLAGQNIDTTLSLVLDTNFLDLQNYPVLQGENPWLYRYIDSISDTVPRRYTYWVEKQERGIFINRGRSNWFGTLRVDFWRELFVCADRDSELCDQGEYVVWNLETNTAVRDSATISELIKQMDLDRD